MNIDRIIRKVLLEQPTETKTKGIDYADQQDVIQKGITNCPTFASYVEGRTIKSLPSSEIPKYPELAGYTSVAYITQPVNKDGVGRIFFGIKDPSKTDKVAFLSYLVSAGSSPVKYKNGWGFDCEFFQTTETLGKDTLGTDQKNILDAYLTNNKNSSAEYPSGADRSEWSKLPYNQIPGLEGYKGSGYIWVMTTMQNTNVNDLKRIESLLGDNFTTDETLIGETEFEFGVILSDLVKEIPSLSAAAKKAPNLKVYPRKGKIVLPDKKVCKQVIKKLKNCQNGGVSAGEECRGGQILFDKYTAVMCDNPKYNYVKGVFGVEDEFNELKNDGTSKYGLANLMNSLKVGLGGKKETPTTPTLKESLSKKISRILNEEYRKLNNL